MTAISFVVIYGCLCASAAACLNEGGSTPNGCWSGCQPFSSLEGITFFEDEYEWYYIQDKQFIDFKSSFRVLDDCKVEFSCHGDVYFRMVDGELDHIDLYDSVNRSLTCNGSHWLITDNEEEQQAISKLACVKGYFESCDPYVADATVKCPEKYNCSEATVTATIDEDVYVMFITTFSCNPADEDLWMIQADKEVVYSSSFRDVCQRAWSVKAAYCVDKK